MYGSLYQSAQNNFHKFTDKLTLKWDKDDTPVIINQQLEKLNSPHPDNIVSEWGRSKQFIEITITDKTDVNHSKLLLYIHGTTRNSTWKITKK